MSHAMAPIEGRAHGSSSVDTINEVKRGGKKQRKWKEHRFGRGQVDHWTKVSSTRPCPNLGSFRILRFLPPRLKN